jgi:nucleoside-diphosphate-sugar epimerase
MIRNKRIFISGGAGFIGTSLAYRLSDKNEIVLFDNLHRNAVQGTDLLKKPNVRLIRGDVLNAGEVREAIKGSTHVVHMASIAGVDTVMKNPVTTMKVSILGTINVLDAAFEMKNIERFIDFSTSEVFGRYAYKVTEGDTSQLGAVGEARWTYAVSKLATEHLALNYFKQHGFPSVSIRPFNIYGPGQVGEGAVHHFIVHALKNEDIIIHNDGSQIRSWCHIDDIVDGICLALEDQNAKGEAFNIGNPRSTLTIFNLAQEITRLCNSNSAIKFVQWNFPDVELRIPDISKARKLLGFEPKIDLVQGLKKTIEWYQMRSDMVVKA